MRKKKNDINPGDIFCIEIDKSYKCFFKYIGNDKTNLNRTVIKVFLTRFALNKTIEISEILAQKDYFFTCGFIDNNIDDEALYKVGNVDPSESQDKDQYKFISYTRPKELTKENLDAPEEYSCWWIWNMNEEAHQVFPAPYDIIDQLEVAAPHRSGEIIERIKIGYYTRFSPEYDVIKRKPLPGVQSYLKTQCVPEIVYYHFDGEDLERQITISKTDGSVKINKLKGKMKFWDRNWEPYEFIPRQQFEYAWIKYHPMNPINAISGLASNLFKS